MRLVCHSQGGQTVAGHQVAWVNNQFQQYIYDVTNLVGSPTHGDTNVTVAFESAWLYGLNVTARPDIEVTANGDVCHHGLPFTTQLIARACSLNTLASDKSFVRPSLILAGIGYVILCVMSMYTHWRFRDPHLCLAASSNLHI